MGGGGGRRSHLSSRGARERAGRWCAACEAERLTAHRLLRSVDEEPRHDAVSKPAAVRVDGVEGLEGAGHTEAQVEQTADHGEEAGQCGHRHRAEVTGAFSLAWTETIGLLSRWLSKRAAIVLLAGYEHLLRR